MDAVYVFVMVVMDLPVSARRTRVYVLKDAAQ